ncbi:hypothetical protein [Bosea beijingensis]|uniref:hypothetical protein n=1 Tax=Bosea beijingensis TaxID=3068632 RepID=UPI002740948C|nr:hypothetical protein [Bosea sp. REN20]
MDVLELYDLAAWYRRYNKNLNSLYSALHSILSQNASQPTQQPIEDQLDKLVEFLKEMDLGELSLQQVGVLDHLKVGHLLGPLGADFIERTVKTASYDPASTEKRVQEAIERLNLARQKMDEYYNSISNLEINHHETPSVSGRIIVRVGFKNEAAIENIVDWKDSSEDWHHIIRGVALVAGEAPENTKIVGASKGSIIIILATTVTVTKILAMIAKHAKSIAMDIIDVQNAIEDLRKKKLSNKTIEAELNKKINASKSEGISAINKDLLKLMPKNAPGDARNALEKSIEKLLKFGEDGGDLDFVSPPDEEIAEIDDEDEKQSGDAAAAEIQEARKIIRDYQTTREAMRLLEHRTGD